MKRRSPRWIGVAALWCAMAAPSWAQYVVGTGGSVDMPGGGTWAIGCIPVVVQGSLNVGSGQFTTGSHFTVAGTGVVNGGSGLLSVGGNLGGGGTFHAQTGTVLLTDGCVGNTSQLLGNMVFRNLTLSSTTGRTFVIPAGTHITVLGTLTLQGTPGQSIQLVSSGGGTAVISLAPGAIVQRSHANVAGDVLIGAPASPHHIPSLTHQGLVLLALLMGAGALWRRHRRPHHTPRL